MTASVNTEVEAYNAGDAAANEKAPSTKEEKTAPESDTGTGSAGKRRNRTHSPIVKYRGVRGTVKWFSVNKGYGFIHVNDDQQVITDNHEDIFVHSSAIVRQTRQALSLVNNQEVEFDIVKGIKGLEAACVAGPEGQRVGTTFVPAFAVRGGRGPGRLALTAPRRRSEGDVHDNNGGGPKQRERGQQKKAIAEGKRKAQGGDNMHDSGPKPRAHQQKEKATDEGKRQSEGGNNDDNNKPKE